MLDRRVALLALQQEQAVKQSRLDLQVRRLGCDSIVVVNVLTTGLIVIKVGGKLANGCLGVFREPNRTVARHKQFRRLRHPQ